MLLRDSEHLPPLGMWDPSNRDASPRLRLCGPKGLSHRWCLNEIQSTVLNITHVRSVTHVGPLYITIPLALCAAASFIIITQPAGGGGGGYGSWFIVTDSNECSNWSNRLDRYTKITYIISGGDSTSYCYSEKEFARRLRAAS